MPRIWTEEQKAQAAATRQATKERKAARVAAAVEVIETPQVARSDSVTVIYRPFDGDPHTTVWNGIRFQANVPVRLDRSNRLHHINQLLPQKFAGEHGQVLTKHAEQLVFMGDMARVNPSFEVDGLREKRLINSRIVPPAGHEWTDAHEGQISESYVLDKVD